MFGCHAIPYDKEESTERECFGLHLKENKVELVSDVC